MIKKLLPAFLAVAGLSSCVVEDELVSSSSDTGKVESSSSSFVEAKSSEAYSSSSNDSTFLSSSFSSSEISSSSVEIYSSSVSSSSIALSSSTIAYVKDTISVEISGANVQDGEVSFVQSQVVGNKSNENHDSWTWLSVGTYDYSTLGRTVIQFALPDSLKGAEVLSSSLVLEVQKWLSKSANDSAVIIAHPIKKSWNEKEVTAQSTGNGSSWSKVGLDVNGLDAGEQVAQVSKKFGTMGVWSLNLTPLVQSWLSGDVPNYGVVLRNSTEMQSTIHGYPLFWSKNGDITKGPKLKMSVVRTRVLQ